MTDYEVATDKILVSRKGAALEITFNNPQKHNALSVDMWRAVPPLLKQAEMDPDVRIIVFCGSGSKAFVSGADISQFENERAAQEAVDRYEVMAEGALLGILGCEKPTLAAVSGFCFGAGVNVAAACDIRVAAKSSLFCVPAAKLGLGYRLTAMQNLIDVIGMAATKDILYTARRVGTMEALQMGLITAWAEDEAFGKLVEQYCTQIAENAPLTIRAAKRIARELTKPAAAADVHAAKRWITECFESMDYTEGRSAFMEKRKPVFRGN
jgi:enoyl-CoA hydratase/carnithine racemase